MLTVTVPAASRWLTTREAMRLELGIAAGADDELLTYLIEQASGTIESWCNRTFALETVQEVLRLPYADPVLILRRWPIVAITAVTEDGLVLDSSQFEAEADRGLLYALDGRDNRRNWKRGKVVIEYQAGYVLPETAPSTLPADVQRAAIQLAKAGWFAADRDPLIKSETIDGAGSATYWTGNQSDDSGLPAEVVGLLTPYRQPAIG